jgi:hypothetical protein
MKYIGKMDRNARYYKREGTNISNREAKITVNLELVKSIVSKE